MTGSTRHQQPQPSDGEQEARASSPPALRPSAPEGEPAGDRTVAMPAPPAGFLEHAAEYLEAEELAPEEVMLEEESAEEVEIFDDDPAVDMPAPPGATTAIDGVPAAVLAERGGAPDAGFAEEDADGIEPPFDEATPAVEAYRSSRPPAPAEERRSTQPPAAEAHRSSRPPASAEERRSTQPPAPAGEVRRSQPPAMGAGAPAMGAGAPETVEPAVPTPRMAPAKPQRPSPLLFPMDEEATPTGRVALPPPRAAAAYSAPADDVDAGPLSQPPRRVMEPMPPARPRDRTEPMMKVAAARAAEPAPPPVRGEGTDPMMRLPAQPPPGPASVRTPRRREGTDPMMQLPAAPDSSAEPHSRRRGEGTDPMLRMPDTAAPPATPRMTVPRAAAPAAAPPPVAAPPLQVPAAPPLQVPAAPLQVPAAPLQVPAAPPLQVPAAPLQVPAAPPLQVPAAPLQVPAAPPLQVPAAPPLQVPAAPVPAAPAAPPTPAAPAAPAEQTQQIASATMTGSYAAVSAPEQVLPFRVRTGTIPPERPAADLTDVLPFRPAGWAPPALPQGLGEPGERLTPADPVPASRREPLYPPAPALPMAPPQAPNVPAASSYPPVPAPTHAHAAPAHPHAPVESPSGLSVVRRDQLQAPAMLTSLEALPFQQHGPPSAAVPSQGMPSQGMPPAPPAPPVWPAQLPVDSWKLQPSPVPFPFAAGQGMPASPQGSARPGLPQGMGAPTFGQVSYAPDPGVVAPASLGLNAPRLTLEQYACLAAELAVAPANAAQVRQRYGLDDTTHLAEQGAWQRRFSLDAQLFANYSSLFQHYRDWLAQSARGR